MSLANTADICVERATWTIPETARILGLSRAAAYRAAARGDIPARRIGGRLIVPRAALSRMLELHQETPPPSTGRAGSPTARRACSHSPKMARSGAQWTKAKTFLLEELAAGRLEAGEVRRRAKQAGIAERTLERARQSLGVRAEKGRGSAREPWYWSLPAAAYEEGESHAAL